MRSRLGLFISTAVLSFAVLGGVAVAHYSDCEPEPSVVTYEINQTKTKTTYFFFIFKKYATTTTISVQQQCQEADANDTRYTTTTVKYGPDNEYCWVTQTTTKPSYY